jgi:manganese efflux pump family protein
VTFLTLIGLAVGLSMDAFAVAIGVGLTLEGASRRQTLRLALHFGLFQAFMPIIGWLAGLTVARWIAPFDHWVAFGLLAAIGGKMIYESFRHEEPDEKRPDPTRGGSLVLLSVATSIDALAVGLSLALIDVEIWYPALVIGLVAGALTALGMWLGDKLGDLFGKRMETLGGLVLVAIGVKILVDHLL